MSPEEIADLQSSYDSACRHADSGWKYLEVAVRALLKIASIKEGDVVNSSFDEPNSALIARAVLYDLPTCGVHEDVATSDAIRRAAMQLDKGKS